MEYRNGPTRLEDSEGSDGGRRTWTFPLRVATPRPTYRLLVFPYAGAGATAMLPLARLMPASIDVTGVALPGRERRFSEPAAATVSEVVGGVERELRAMDPLPTYFLGHCMGASLAIALAACSPVACAGLLLSGRLPTGPAVGPESLGDDADTVLLLKTIGHTNPELLSDPYWRRRLVSLIRHDRALAAEAAQLTHNPRVSQRIMAVGGKEDPYVDSAQLYKWAGQTTCGCDVRVYRGGHFYLLDPANVPAVSAGLAKFITAGS
jgi:pyochelin biosynthesis protein PchC